MNIRLDLSRLKHLFRLLWASFLTLFTSRTKKTVHSSDIEAGVLHAALKDIGMYFYSSGERVSLDNTRLEIPSSEVIEIRLPDSMTKAEHESNQPLSRDVPERRPSRMHPVKSRILDATLKNVRDKRFSTFSALDLDELIMSSLIKVSSKL